MMDNDEVSPPSLLLFANPGARCHVSDVACLSSDFDPTQQDNNGRMDSDNHDATQRQGVDTNSYEGSPPPTKTMAHHHPQHWRQGPRPSTTPRMPTTAQHHPMNDDNGPHHPNVNDNGPLPAPPHEWRTWPSTTP